MARTKRRARRAPSFPLNNNKILQSSANLLRTLQKLLDAAIFDQTPLVPKLVAQVIEARYRQKLACALKVIEHALKDRASVSDEQVAWILRVGKLVEAEYEAEKNAQRAAYVADNKVLSPDLKGQSRREANWSALGNNGKVRRRCFDGRQASELAAKVDRGAGEEVGGKGEGERCAERGLWC